MDKTFKCLVARRSSRRLFAILSIIVIVVSSATILYFCLPHGQIVVPEHYATIQKAIDNANEGDTIFVRSGTYNESLHIYKSINLVGEDPKNTKIVGLYPYDANAPVIYENNANITVSGFTLIGRVGIKMELTHNSQSTIKSCYFTSNDYGIMAIRTGTRPLIVSECTFSNNKERALYIWNGRASFSNNILTNNNIALYAWHGTFEVFQNTIANNSVGTQFAPGCSNCTVSYNNFNNNKIGIQLDQFPPHPEYTIGEQNKVYSNNFYNNYKQVATVSMGEYDSNIYVGTDIISWTDGGTGNYWSDYSGNGEYVIDQNNVDYYPLAQPVEIFK